MTIPSTTWRDVAHSVNMDRAMIMLPMVARNSCKDCFACCFNFGNPSGGFLDTTKTKYYIPNEDARKGKEFFALLPRTLVEDTGNSMCPLFTPDGCLIYEDRPTTCRTFYCNGILFKSWKLYIEYHKYNR